MATALHRYNLVRQYQCSFAYAVMPLQADRDAAERALYHHFRPSCKTQVATGPAYYACRRVAMTFDGAVIREQGVTFALVVVKHHVVQSRFEAARAITSFQPCFPGVPIVPVGQNSRGTPTYFGRPEIARFMARVPMNAVPWRTYTI